MERVCHIVEQAENAGSYFFNGTALFVKKLVFFC
jgi:hypothetical protein